MRNNDFPRNVIMIMLAKSYTFLTSLNIVNHEIYSTCGVLKGTARLQN